MEWQGKVMHGMESHDKERHGMERHDKTSECNGKAK
jgi:hypothetical protein